MQMHKQTHMHACCARTCTHAHAHTHTQSPSAAAAAAAAAHAQAPVKSGFRVWKWSMTAANRITQPLPASRPSIPAVAKGSPLEKGDLERNTKPESVLRCPSVQRVGQ
jgi:hypothetical protein